MASVIWSPEALADVESIAAFIARDSQHAAAVFSTRILAATERLESFPNSGRVVREFEDGSIREIIVASYRVIYRVRDIVEVLTVVHAARRLS